MSLAYFPTVDGVSPPPAVSSKRVCWCCVCIKDIKLYDVNHTYMIVHTHTARVTEGLIINADEPSVTFQYTTANGQLAKPWVRMSISTAVRAETHEGDIQKSIHGN